eukprot:c2476_g1_i1.p1 GENE.c2476_g1_i1~~c2476_g1_i1.p1  ORF type:complete len:222 (+),score=34.50 c2476_g1_i1:34-699(+)
MLRLVVAALCVCFVFGEEPVRAEEPKVLEAEDLGNDEQIPNASLEDLFMPRQMARPIPLQPFRIPFPQLLRQLARPISFQPFRFPFPQLPRQMELPISFQPLHMPFPQLPDHVLEKSVPMILKLDEHDDFFVISGVFPGVSKSDLKLKLDGSRLVVNGKVTNKNEETQHDLGEFGDIDEVEEVMELPYAPDARLFKARFDESKHTLTVVFPKPKTTEIELL